MTVVELIRPFVALSLILTIAAPADAWYQGRDPAPGRAPGEVLIENGNGRCSGVFISRRHILTAGHCVYLQRHLFRKLEYRDPSPLFAFLDIFPSYNVRSLKWWNDNETLGKSQDTENVYVHPSNSAYLGSPEQLDRQLAFIGDGADRQIYDLAVIELKQAWNLPFVRVRPAPLAVGELVDAGGHGRKSLDSDGADDMLFTTSRAKVSRQLAHLNRLSTTDAETRRESFALSGDSGGPVYSTDPKTGEIELAGIMALGEGQDSFLGILVSTSGSEAVRLDQSTPAYAWIQGVLGGRERPTVVGAEW